MEAMAKEENLRVEIETNGSVPLQPFAEIPNGPSFTMDYKLPGSGMEKYSIWPKILQCFVRRIQ